MIKLLTFLVFSSLALPAFAADTVQPRREEMTLSDQKKDPSTAALLSLLYPGAGQLYLGNNSQRSLYILGGGTLLLGGSLVGYGILADRPEDSVAFGNILITGVLLGYHLWNVRDAYDQAAMYNQSLEEMNRLSFSDPLRSASKLASANLFSWSTQF